MTDELIIDLYCKRSENAITESNLKYGSYCFSIAHNILDNREDAEECVNDTWLKTWNCIPPQRPSEFRIFLAKITRNLSIDRYRRMQSQKRGSKEIILVFDELEECISSNSDVEQEYQTHELLIVINEFLRHLSVRDRNIFLLRYFNVDSTSVIANKFCMKEATVLVVLSRTRKKLKSFLMKEGF